MASVNRIVVLTAALEAIIKHQDAMGGELATLSTTRLIAQRALDHPSKDAPTTLRQLAESERDAWQAQHAADGSAESLGGFSALDQLLTKAGDVQ